MSKECPFCLGSGQIGNWPSESAKYVHLVEHLMPPEFNVLDLGSGGWPIVPHAIQVELHSAEFRRYTSGQSRPPIQWKGNALDLPFRDRMVDVLFSSHLIEDIYDQREALVEWQRVVKYGGLMIIMHPDRDIWNYCIQHRGQPPNCAHKAERKAGELGEIGRQIGLEVIKDELTNLFEFDYNILTILRVT